jgi:hypothetical protein
VEDLLSGTYVAGTGRLPYLMEGESARAVEEGQPSQTGAAPRAGWLVVATAASSHASSAATDSLERPLQERLEALGLPPG